MKAGAEHDLSGLPELPEGFHWEIYPKDFWWDSSTRVLSAMVVAICRDVPKRVGLFKTERTVVKTFLVERDNCGYTYYTVPTTPKNIVTYAGRCLRDFTIKMEQRRKAEEEAIARKQFAGVYKKKEKK